MPQPLKNQGAEYHSDPIADRPVAAAALANAIAAWNLFEWELAVSYSIAMGFYLPGYKGWEPPNHPMAYDIMDTISGLGARLDLMHVALKRVAPSLVEDFVAMRPEIRKQAGKRAELAHGRWGINSLFPDDIIKEDEKGFSRWNAKDFKTRADAFFALRLKFLEFLLKLRELMKQRPGLKEPPKLHAPKPEPQSAK